MCVWRFDKITKDQYCRITIILSTKPCNDLCDVLPHNVHMLETAIYGSTNFACSLRPLPQSYQMDRRTPSTWHFLLRDVEASTANISAWVLGDTKLELAWLLPGSKSDHLALGVKRSWGCLCELPNFARP